MEQPYSGRAVINESFGEIQILIPSQKNWFAITFLCFWLCAWAFGLVMAGTTMFRGGPALFMGVWITFWTLGGLMAMSIVVWQIAGKEIITAGNGTLTIAKKGVPFLKPKMYMLSEVRNIYAHEPELNYAFGRRAQLPFPYRNTGTIHFDYGLKTVRFGEGLDEAEGRYLVDLMKKKKLVQ